MSMVEVRCPHCSVRGQIVLPPMGAIIVGPCPNCNELVVVFCGRVLPLQKSIMVDGTPEQKYDHLRSVLVEFIDDRVRKVVSQLTPEVTEGLHDYSPEAQAAPESSDDGTHSDIMTAEPESKNPPISRSEIDAFLRFDLPRIDNKDYFRAVFE